MTTQHEEFEFSLYEKDGHVARVIINRPDRLNALGREVYRDLMAGMELARNDDDVKVVIIKGNGRAFSAGHDLTQVGYVYGFGTGAPGERKPSQRTRISRDFDELTRRFMYVLLFPKVTIAQVHGMCAGGSRRVVESCDLTVVADDAKISWANERLGFASGFDLWSMLHLGPKKARELGLTGGELTGKEAFDLGWANRCVPADQVESVAESLARVVSHQPRDGIAIGKAFRYLELEELGVASSGKRALFHAMFTNLQWEPDEDNFYKLRREMGTREAIHHLAQAFEVEVPE
ncbi:MAG: enoyl-CoA hydratase/isomerase family protein [Acidimicrobiales bacterium]|jgi:enoyl-CoA hydratase